MIEKKTFLMSIALFLLSLFFVLSGIIKTKDGISELVKENNQLVFNAMTITTLKEKWENKTEIDKTVSKLSAYPNLISSESKNGKYIFSFDIENPQMLDEISNDILNSSVTITSFNIKKTAPSKATLHVEFMK